MRWASSAILHAVHADVDDDGAGADKIARDHGRSPDSGDQDVGFPTDGGKVAGPGVGDGDGGVFGKQQHTHRFPDDVTAADNDGAFAGDGNPVSFEQLNDPGGRAGPRAGASGRERAHITGMKAVDVFRGRDGREELRRHRPAEAREAAPGCRRLRAGC